VFAAALHGKAAGFTCFGQVFEIFGL